MLKEIKSDKMGLLYKVSDKELLSVRNNIFKEVGIPALESNGFVRSPFKTSWFGQYYGGIEGYPYEFCRLSAGEFLEMIEVYIVKGDKYIQIFLNIFELEPSIESLSDLKDYEGIKYGMPPNSLTKMRLRNDDYKGPPLFYMLAFPEHKIGRFYRKTGYEREVSKLKALIKKDMINIDSFVERWHELHKPNKTDREGNRIAGTT